MISIVITSFIEILKHLTDLVKERRDTKRNTLAQFVEPIYTQFQRVAPEYIRLFVTLGEQTVAATDLKQFERAVDDFARQRGEFQLARREVEILAKTYAEHIGRDDVQAFFSGVSEFFYGDSEEASMSRVLQQRLADIVRRRRQIAAEILATQEKAASSSWPMPSSNPMWTGMLGTSATDSIMRGMDRQVAAEKEAALRRDDMGLRAAEPVNKNETVGS
jgi:hypothetical protein